MTQRSDAATQSKPASPFKNRPFRARLGFALSGVRTVFRRERSFRTQCGFAAAAATFVGTVGLDPLWAALIALSTGLVLALEMANAALEYLIDRVHPEVAEEIGHAKDAAAGAVLVASAPAMIVGGLAALSWLGLV